MPEKHLFEYAVIRVVPRVEREEFLNVGVILYCPSEGFLQTKFELNEKRLKAFSEQLDLEELKQRLSTFERICAGKKEGGRIGQLSIAERFRWMASTRSTIIQTSAVHPGLCSNAADTLVHLFQQLVCV
jgi:acyl-CoA-binding protein